MPRHLTRPPRSSSLPKVRVTEGERRAVEELCAFTQESVSDLIRRLLRDEVRGFDRMIQEAERLPDASPGGPAG